MKSTVEQVAEEISRIEDPKSFWLAALEFALANPKNDQVVKTVYERDRERRHERNQPKKG